MFSSVRVSWLTLSMMVVAPMLCPPAARAQAPEEMATVSALRELALPLETEEHLTPLIERAAATRYALLGEASHGTSEYYHWRAAISRRLIQEQGYRFIAVEGDWALCYRVNRYIKGHPDAGGNAREVLLGWDRWPEWMWANEDMVELVTWLRAYNDVRPAHEQVGFYGIDVYDMDRSLRKVQDYLAQADVESASRALEAYACFAPFMDDPQSYARSAAWGQSCAESAEQVVALLRERAPTLRAQGDKEYFNAKQNALVVQNAERHYRAMGSGGGDSWNLRAQHFFQTAERLMELHGPDAKGIVWAHNTHIGDARATSMGQAGRHNIGQLAREAHGNQAVLAVGFAGYQGTVLAGASWGAPAQRMNLPSGAEGSFESLFHRTGNTSMLLLFDDEHRGEGPFMQPRGNRAVGVVYNPLQEQGNYVPTWLPARYDALLYFQDTQALTPLHGPGVQARQPAGG